MLKGDRVTESQRSHLSTWLWPGSHARSEWFIWRGDMEAGMGKVSEAENEGRNVQVKDIQAQ